MHGVGSLAPGSTACSAGGSFASILDNQPVAQSNDCVECTVEDEVRQERNTLTRATVLVINCSGVTRADSAGLAVLLDWLAWGRRKSRAVTLENLPASLVAIARISEVDGLLTAAG